MYTTSSTNASPPHHLYHPCSRTSTTRPFCCLLDFGSHFDSPTDFRLRVSPRPSLAGLRVAIGSLWDFRLRVSPLWYLGGRCPVGHQFVIVTLGPKLDLCPLNMLPEPPKRIRQPVDGTRKLRAPPNSVAERHDADSEAYSAESARPLPTSIKKSGMAGVAPPPVKAPPKPEKLRPQGASVAMGEVTPLLPKIQDCVLETFTHPDIGIPCKCGNPARFRCVDTCWKSPMSCATCIVRKHDDAPFHHIEEWNGLHFQRTSLNVLGLRLQTDPRSGAVPCRNVNPESGVSRNIVVVAENGFHSVTMDFCACPRVSDSIVPEQWEQLIAVRLFPATWRRPETVFTFTVMRQFHVHSLTSKKSAYDYIRALAKLTDNVFPQDVKNRYREFQHSYRIWRYLALERRLGQAFQIDKHTPNRTKGSLTVRCPSCPEVGYNIDEDTLNQASECEKHKYTLYLSADGNFKLQRKNKCDDPDDVALNKGRGYFVEKEGYKKYLTLAKPDEDLGTCAHFRASRMQNMAKFKNAVITGVVAVQCARHGFYMPSGMVDLKKGEAFANTDYALCGALSESYRQRFILVTYDIWCQYGVYLETRVSHMFKRMLPVIRKIRGAIPKMHIHNHQDECEIMWNLNWLEHSACTVGEMIETGWAEQNLTAGSTKEQNDGHRHDSIDDTSGHWNWDKLIKLSTALVRLYRLCALEWRRRSIDFDGCNELTDPLLVAAWEKMDITPKLVDGKLFSVYQANLKNGPPTHAAAYQKLVAAELAAEQAGVASQTGDSALVGTALLIEKSQMELLRMVAKQADDDLIRVNRARLIEDLSELRTRQVQRIPELARLMGDIDVEKPEKELLFLPSEYPSSMRGELKLQTLAQVEYTQRIGHAYEQLQDLRTSIRTLNINVETKRTSLHGNGSNTRGQDYLKTLANGVQIAGSAYRKSYAALLKLGLSADDQALKPLLRQQLRGKDGMAQAAGQVKDSDPWFWRTGRPSGLSESEEEEWNTELDRVKWFRLRALLGRSTEERETLDEEFSRAVLWFHKTANIWRSLAAESVMPGRVAYAEKQADMYTELASRCFIARGTLPHILAADLKKQEVKESKETARAKKVAATAEEDEEDLWDTLG
ncbi:hypothetical protein DFH09DRAFT_1277149 [Mycena vulgaris]|nr:hypothetical protein DFH09DRAFT_1277149 [Mycena vulgaris]